MADYLFLMHTLPDGAPELPWDDYIAALTTSGHMRGGSMIGDGACISKSGVTENIAAHINGYIKIEAKNFEQAVGLLKGNPIFEAGGTIEIRELPLSD
jgi:hypothetical protein